MLTWLFISSRNSFAAGLSILRHHPLVLKDQNLATPCPASGWSLPNGRRGPRCRLMDDATEPNVDRPYSQRPSGKSRAASGRSGSFCPGGSCPSPITASVPSGSILPTASARNWETADSQTPRAQFPLCLAPFGPHSHPFIPRLAPWLGCLVKRRPCDAHSRSLPET